MSFSNTRLDAFRKKLDEQGCDAFFMRSLSDIKWLTGFDGVFDDEPAHVLIIFDEALCLHTDTRYEEACHSGAQGSPIQVDASARSHAAFAADLLGAYGAEAGKKLVLGIEDTLSLGEYHRLQDAVKACGEDIDLRETHAVTAPARGVKDVNELERLRAEQAVADAAFAHIAGFVSPGMSERDVQLELEYFMLGHGASGVAFPSIVATGANAARPHAIPGDNRIEAGQALLLDFGARVSGYCSDMTRMLFIGWPDQRLRFAYQAIRDANEAVEAMLQPGVTGVEAQEKAERVLQEAGFGNMMGHSLGHGLGIDVHEEPVLATRNTAALEVGNVVTVEPGIYIPGEFGMRLEDFGVITHDGFDVFTQSSHDMVII